MKILIFLFLFSFQICNSMDSGLACFDENDSGLQIAFSKRDLSFKFFVNGIEERSFSCLSTILNRISSCLKKKK